MVVLDVVDVVSVILVVVVAKLSVLYLDEVKVNVAESAVVTVVALTSVKEM